MSSDNILKSHPIPKREASAPGEIVLREWGRDQWVTHWHNLDDGGYYYGHYFTNYDEAVADYENRIAEERGY